MIESKEEDMRQCKNLHNKQVTELEELRQNLDKVSIRYMNTDG